MLPLRSWESLCRWSKPTGRPTRTTSTPVSRWSPYGRTSRWVFTRSELPRIFLCLGFSFFLLGCSEVVLCLFASRFREFGLNSRWKCTSATHALLWKRWFVLTVWLFDWPNALTAHLLNSWMGFFFVCFCFLGWPWGVQSVPDPAEGPLQRCSLGECRRVHSIQTALLHFYQKHWRCVTAFYLVPEPR